MSFWEERLLKVGVVMMVIALALTVVAVAATIALRSEPERAAASERGETSVEPLRYGSAPPPPKKPLTEKAQPQSPLLEQPQPKPAAQPPEPHHQQEKLMPEAEAAPWPMPTNEQIERASKPRHYELPPGAIMGLTINALGIHNAPVFDSDDRWALRSGVSHVPDTSLPWSDAPQRNVYLEGHRLGWPGTGSHLIFYRLNWLEKGDEIVLKDREGEAYRYRVSETLVVNPEDVWVMGEVVGRDMVTLQSCTPIPSFEKRLIVRADRT